MIALLKQMIDVYWNMLIFKRSPLNTPDAPMMLGIAVALSLIVSGVQLVLSYSLGKMTIPFWASILLIIAQIGLAFAYVGFILWTQNQLTVWRKMMTCWMMMLFQLDGLALLFMFFILALNLFGWMVVLQKGIIVLSLIVGLLLSFWQVTLSVRLYQIFLQKTMLFAFAVYLGWFGVNFLFLMTFKTLF
jgi:hypothetical protein